MAHPQVEGGKDALFPGHHQTWRMRPGDDGGCGDKAQKQDSGVRPVKFALVPLSQNQPKKCPHE
jgi:hypothetical protein